MPYIEPIDALRCISRKPILYIQSHMKVCLNRCSPPSFQGTDQISPSLWSLGYLSANSHFCHLTWSHLCHYGDDYVWTAVYGQCSFPFSAICELLSKEQLSYMHMPCTHAHVHRHTHTCHAHTPTCQHTCHMCTCTHTHPDAHTHTHTWLSCFLCSSTEMVEKIYCNIWRSPTCIEETRGLFVCLFVCLLSFCRKMAFS